MARPGEQPPKSHPSDAWEGLDIAGGQSPPAPGPSAAAEAEWVLASPELLPASPTKVPFTAGGEEPGAASAAARCQEAAPRSRGPSRPPGMQMVSGQKELVGAGAALCLALAPISSPETGPASANQSSQTDRRMSAGLQCMAFPTGRSQQGAGMWQCTGIGVAGAVVVPLVSPLNPVMLIPGCMPAAVKQASAEHTVAANLSSLHLQERSWLPNSV